MWSNFRPVVNDRGWHKVDEYDTCPACLRRSAYLRSHDRFVHLDGSANVECWCAISRGETMPRRAVRRAPAEAEAA
jgi:hypothetical protein